jgi:hypothetical protein
MFRDTMNGHALVRAACPDLEMSPLVCSGDVSGVNESLKRVQKKVMMITTTKTSVEKRVQMVVNQLRSGSSSSA